MTTLALAEAVLNATNSSNNDAVAAATATRDAAQTSLDARTTAVTGLLSPEGFTRLQET